MSSCTVKTNNTYNVVVVASDDPDGAGTGRPGSMGSRWGYEKVTVNVTDVDEPWA